MNPHIQDTSRNITDAFRNICIKHFSLEIFCLINFNNSDTQP